ncbi:MAG: hypothetical protein [Bacteriophage sp.]|nr:MAG: hypothetical protein [Bacteriophage sp.]
MKATDIIALATAGYTAEQIAVIAKAAKEQPVQQPVQQPDGYADLMGRLDALTTQIQQSAILNSAQPREETADDILANIIDPPEFHPKK